MEHNIEIKIGNISDPPEKMRLMYEALAQLVREHREISGIKVSEITAKAGIGKGTAYEYFSSKEELVAHALVYEYSIKIQKLSVSAFEPEHFRERCYRVMDWIRDNREYNLMFSQMFRTGPKSASGGHSCPLGDFGGEAHRYIHDLVDRFMEDAYREGAITETDAGKRALAFFTAMLEYAFVVMSPPEPRYSRMAEEELRTFVYESLVRALTGTVTSNLPRHLQ